MWVVIIVLLISLVIILLEMPQLWKKKQKKELLVLLLLLILGTSYNITFYTGRHSPDPSDWLTTVFQPLNDKIMRLLK